MWNGGKSHMIFVMHPPRTDGGLTSPVNAMRQEMLMMRRMLENEEYASYWAPRPLHATEVVRDFTSTGGGGGGNRDAMVTLGPGTFGPQDKQDEERLRRLRKNLEEHIDLQLATRAAREGRQLTIEEKQQFKQSLFEVGQAEKPTASDLNPAAMVSPSEHMLPLPVNQHLVGGPTPSSYSNLKDIMEILFPLAYATMNIPESIIKPGGSQVKGDPEMAKQEWDHFIKSQQEILGHMLEEIYSVCYNERGRSFINAFYRVWKEEAKALKRKSSSDLSTRDEPFQEAKQALQRAGRTELADLLRKQRQDTMKQVVTQNVRVTIAHDYTPSVSIELLMQARQLNVFDDDYLVQSVGRLLCVPTEKILNKQQREAQKNAQVEEQASTLDTQLKVKSKYGEKPGDSDVKGAFPSPAKKQKS